MRSDGVKTLSELSLTLLITWINIGVESMSWPKEYSLSNVKVSYKEEVEETNLSAHKVFSNVTQAVVRKCSIPKGEDFKNDSSVVVMVPIILAQFTLEFTLNPQVNLPEEIEEVSKISREVQVTKAVLLPDTNTLFVQGNIEEALYGDSKSLTTYIPFTCTTAVIFNIEKPETIVFNDAKDLNYYVKPVISDKSSIWIEDQDDTLGEDDDNYYSQITTEYYNKAPYCQVVSSKIVSNLISTKGSSSPESPSKTLHENLTIYITLKILQDRYVVLPK